jgi:uncharacterized protein YbaA (DUF1428 family)
MTYVDGFVAAVPQANKAAYLDHVREAAALFKDHGAVRMVENWGDDVPAGKVTDFHRSVRKKDDEAVLFSWIEWPSREARDTGMKALMQDERMKTLKMPFDGQRLIFGGFSPIIETGSAKGAEYADGFVVPVPAVNRDAYIRMALNMSSVFKEYGALRVVEGWGDDVPDGKVTDFRRAVEAKDGETIVFSWIEWPSKQARDDAWPKLMADPRMRPDKANISFDAQRMIFGGFATMLHA